MGGDEGLDSTEPWSGGMVKSREEHWKGMVSVFFRYAPMPFIAVHCQHLLTKLKKRHLPRSGNSQSRTLRRHTAFGFPFPIVQVSHPPSANVHLDAQ